MHRFLQWLAVVLGAVLMATTAVTGASAAGVAQGAPPAATPYARTPQILDTAALSQERVLDMVQVGGRIVVAGHFAQVRDVAANGGGTFNRTYVFAFDPATGAVDRAFAPVVNGVVRAVAAGPNNTVYLGGSFTTVNGATARNLAQVSLATGAVTGFRAAALNGAVNDLAVAGGRLFVGGVFNTAGGMGHGGLATLNPVTGAVDPYMGIDVNVNHNWPTGDTRAPVGVDKLDISPDGSRLVATGNFKMADGLSRDQVLVALLQSDTAVVDPNWRTRGYEAACAANAYDYYVRGVQFSPDGSFFAIVTTGAAYAGTLCDTVARWDTSDTGQEVKPRWVNYTGGDTLHSVAVSDVAVYVGGHQRWLNNSAGRDFAAAGAVPRPGLAAVDPRTGVPLAWNPGRNPRGIGAEALLLTSSGLYVGSDTEYIGNRKYLRPRLAYFPLAGGTPLPSEKSGSLPANVYLAGRPASTTGAGVDDVLARYYDGTTASPDAAVPAGDLQWSKARGAFMAGTTLFYGYPSSSGAYYLHRRTFDGTTYGPATAIDPYNDPLWSTVESGSTRNGSPIYYRGALPSLYGQLSSVSGMFFADGRLYYTRTGFSQLFYRGFSVDSGIVSADEFTAASTGFSDVAGMFVSGGFLFYGTANGDLRRVTFANGVPGSSAQVVSGPAVDGRNWRTRAMFLGPGRPPAANPAPTATFSSSCADLECSFDASGSTDDGSIASYSWDFGDGATATGARAAHTFSSAGTYSVQLRVTDNEGATATHEASVTVSPPAPGAGIAFRASAEKSARGVSSISVTVPPSVQEGDGLVLVLSTNSAVTGAAPTGYTRAGSQVAGTSMTTQVFERVAVPGEAGRTVTVPLSGSASATLQLLAYSQTAAGGPVAAVAGAADTVAGSSHTTPTVDAVERGWVLWVWSDKSASARSWTPPSSGATTRSNLAGVGTGDVATLVGDSGAGKPAGAVPGLTATVSASSAKATMLSIVLAPPA